MENAEWSDDSDEYSPSMDASTETSWDSEHEAVADALNDELEAEMKCSDDSDSEEEFDLQKEIDSIMERGGTAQDIEDVIVRSYIGRGVDYRNIPAHFIRGVVFGLSQSPHSRDSYNFRLGMRSVDSLLKPEFVNPNWRSEVDGSSPLSEVGRAYYNPERVIPLMAWASEGFEIDSYKHKDFIKNQLKPFLEAKMAEEEVLKQQLDLSDMYNHFLPVDTDDNTPLHLLNMALKEIEEYE